MKKDRYFRGLVTSIQTALITDDIDPCRDARDYLEAHDRIPARPEWRDWDLGMRAGARMVRDHGVTGAIDLIAARLWKWGAEEELDRFLSFVGTDLEGEPVRLQKGGLQ